MGKLRRVGSIVLVCPALLMAACGTDGTGEPTAAPADGSASSEVMPTDASAEAPPPEQTEEPAEPGRQPGDVSPPEAREVADLKATDSATGLVLVQEDQDEGCVILTYADGELKRLGTFAQTTVERRPSVTRPCSVRRYYSSDFSFRVNDIHPEDAGPDGTDSYVVVQDIDGEEVDISDGRNLRSPVIGPDDNVYVQDGATPSIMDRDGSNLRENPDFVPNPDWLGGQIVEAGYKGAASADGSMSAFLVKKNLYSVGPLRDEDAREYVAAGDGEFLEPLAWVGEDQFLTFTGGTIFLNTVMAGSGDEKPTISTESFANLPDDYAEEVDNIEVCDNTAFFTQGHRGNSQVAAGNQTVLLGMNLGDGEMTAHASLLDGTGDQGRRGTTILDCIQ